MAYTIPHHASNSGNSNSPSVAITSPTSGNLLVAFFFGTTLGTPSVVSLQNWTRQIDDTAGTENQVVYYRISSGVEGALDLTISTIGPWSAYYIEIAGFTTGSTPTLDQYSWSDSGSTSVGTISNQTPGNGTDVSGCVTAHANEVAVEAFGWDPPMLSEYAWVDGIRLPRVTGAHSGGKSAGSFTGFTYTQVDTNLSQVNAAGVSAWNTAANSGTGLNEQPNYSVSGPAAGNLMSFFGASSSSSPTFAIPIIINQAANRSSNF